MDKNSEDVFYMFMETKIEGGDTLFTSKVYDNQFNLTESCSEHITESGSQLKKYLFSFEEGDVEGDNAETDMYKWNHSREEPITWSVSYIGPEGFESVSKTRDYRGKSTETKFNGKSIETIQFRDEFKVELGGEQGKNRIKFYQNSYYAKGIGMVRYNRIIEDNPNIDFRLVEILTEQEWDGLINN